ncbi:16S rRNA (guanine(527)-N(7))-methyltransferase RsmG [Candidatus Electronema sp. JM]|uniref:16S rRNA (guanine(527)-N(7))-methyltransferase RsmG n=1 Tax=Candidatus Electronema sp. JM TaxID=3401571 RepID=UPI003AA9AAEE
MCDRKQFLLGLERLDISISSAAVDKLLLYCQELQKWNRKINLLARETTAAEMVEKHFLDSLALLPLLHKHGGSAVGAKNFSSLLLDVGSGAGFPGLVLAAAMPELRVTLLEPRQKRTAFLRHVVRTLGLSNVQVREERLEPGQPLPEQFTFITSRAVAAPEIFLPLIEAAAGPETVVILMLAEEERQSWDAGRWETVERLKFVLPFSGDPRLLAAVRKLP